jgi:hypothetical protein
MTHNASLQQEATEVSAPLNPTCCRLVRSNVEVQID